MKCQFRLEKLVLRMADLYLLHTKSIDVYGESIHEKIIHA